MALRRSARVSLKTDTIESKPLPVEPTVDAVRSKKRNAVSAPTKKNIKSTNDAQDNTALISTPATPNKRRRTAPKIGAPTTPTPSAIGLMTSMSHIKSKNYSTGDIDDDGDTRPRPIKAHRTNATLLTPHGTQVEPTYSNFEESPSKPGPNGPLTSQTVLEQACNHLSSVDPKLATVISKHYCQVFSPKGLAETIDPFRSLASGIMAQQVSGAAAKSIKNKFIALFEGTEGPNGFPTPQEVAATPLGRLREAGLSQRKAEYIQGLAEKFDSRELTVEMLMKGSDEEVMQKLVAVRGLGAWSVEMFMCFGLKRLDVFSTGDLGVQRGMAAYMGRDVAKLKAKGGGKWKYMSEKDMLEISEKFRPYRSLFMWYMWRIEDVNVDAIQNNNSDT